MAGSVTVVCSDCGAIHSGERTDGSDVRPLGTTGCPNCGARPFTPTDGKSRAE